MITEQQRDALSVIEEILRLAPEIRLGQLFAHFGFLSECEGGQGLGYVEDAELLAVMQHHRAELLARTPDIPNPAPEAERLTSI